MADPFLQALPSGVDLPAKVRELHSGEGIYSGRCKIERGQGGLVALMLCAGRFPPDGDDIPVCVTISRTGPRWTWERDFSGHKTRSRMTYDRKAACVRESFGSFSIWLLPEWTGHRLNIAIRRLTILGIPIPAFLLPRSSTVEWQDEQERFRFDVSARMPGIGLLIRYRGWLTPDHGLSDHT